MRAMLVTGFYPGKRIGGSEYQTSLLAQGLAAKGHDVVFLASAAGREGRSETDGITLREIPGWRETGWQRHRQLVADVLKETESDICYVRLLTELSSISVLCQPVHIPVVSASSSLREVSPLLTGYYPVETFAHLRSGRTVPHLRSFMAIRSSAAHVCNTRALQRRIQRWFPNKPIRTIYNGQPVPLDDELHTQSTGQIIWVNNLKRRKRPHLFIELARRLPEYRFVMVGGKPAGGRYAETLDRMLQAAPANFEYLGSRPLDKVNTLIQASDLLLYTSKAGSEGFGNSFLQAWFRAVPTVSLSCALDGILARESIGRLCETFEQLVSSVGELMGDETSRLEMGRRARAYAVSHHSTEKMVTGYEALFQEVLNGVDGSQAPAPMEDEA